MQEFPKQNKYEKKVDFESPYPSPANLNLEIHHLDIGQGDSTLIVVRDGERIAFSVLVDGGESGCAPLIHEYMNRVGIKLLDIIVITHYDADHCRGIIELLNNSVICQNAMVFDRGESDDTDKDLKLDDSMKRKEVEDDRIYDDEVEQLKLLLAKTKKKRMTQGKSGKSVVGIKVFEIISKEMKTELSMTCISGNGYILNGKYVTPMHSDRENALSLGFLIQFNEFTYFLGGDSPGTPKNDLEGAIGTCLTGYMGLEHVCSVKVSHHGSHHSTRSDYINLIKPSCAFISCGDHLKHQHPRQEPITVLQNAKSIKNFFLTRCAFKREHITPHGMFQTGKARVAGSENTLGTIVLRVDHSMTCYHVFHVGYWDREVGEWRLIRFGCEVEVSEEIGGIKDTDKHLIINPCGKKTSVMKEILIADAITRRRAKFDEKVVCSFGIKPKERNAIRCGLIGDEKAEEYESKTTETEEMIMKLDKKVDREIKKKQKKEEGDDEDFSFNSEEENND